MHLSGPLPIIAAALLTTPGLTLAAITTTAPPGTDPAAPCYGPTLPALTPSSEHRGTPWSTPSLHLPDGTTCCNSLDQVRAGIDAIDAQLLDLLARRAGYVREATRFKATLDTVDVPSRDAAVIQGAVDKANTTLPMLPALVAKGVFTAIITASVPFEECVFKAFEGMGSD